MTAYKYQKQHASNYNYKPKRSFKQKLKNFFTIPEEDLKEEPTKKFEKIKLFTLTRGSLFLGILIFMILINILVGFNINFLYLRQILGFLFLILVPGLLIMLCFKIRTVKFWEYLVYTVGLSVAFIMFAGLAVNWTLPALGITDKPLSLWPILICFNIFLLALWFTAVYRNRDLRPFDITIPKLDAINRIFFVIPIFFPLLSILGAFLLNNHGSNILTMVMLGAIAIYVLLLVIFRKRMNENVWPWAISLIFLSFLLSFTLRSWFISGWDISQEMYVFRLASENEIWLMGSYNDPYNSCLSLSILPTVINLFLKVSNQLIFKLFVQIIFISHALTVFLIFKKYLSSFLSFVISFLYFRSGDFNSVFPTHIRLEIAFIFFGLMILMLFTKDLKIFTKKILFVLFGVSMIVSHYSTSYIALAMLTLVYVFILIYKIQENQKIKKGKKSMHEKTDFFLTGALVLLLLIFGFLWLSQMTDTSEGLILTSKKTYENIHNVFSWDLKQYSVQSALFGSARIKGYTNADLVEHIRETEDSSNLQNLYAEEKTGKYSPRIIFGGEVISPIGRVSKNIFNYIYQFVKYLTMFSFIFGSLFILLSKKKRLDKEFSFLLLISVFLMILIFLLPYVSKAYTFERMFQQCLIFLSISFVVFFNKIIKSKKFSVFFITFISLFYSLFSLGFFLQISGGIPSLNLYNYGFTYNALYSHSEEINSINWINQEEVEGIIYLDPYSQLKFYSFGDPTKDKITKIIPSLISKSSYTYSNFANKLKKVNYWDAREKFNGGVLSFNFPTEFLNDNKNKIYCNGGSEIFK